VTVGYNKQNATQNIHEGLASPSIFCECDELQPDYRNLTIVLLQA